MTSPGILLASLKLRPKKQLGQNFLSDPSTAEMIVARARILPEDVILEIGAGLGALTVPAARIARQVYAVDTDRHLTEILKAELLAKHILNVTVTEQNILTADISAYSREAGQPLTVMGNLPYNISSQILVRLIFFRSSVTRAILMFQKELAQRLLARPGCKDYGRLTVMLRYCSDIRPVAAVKASVFFPRPQVDSEVLEITFKPVPDHPADNEEFLFKVIKAAFGQRRKTLRNALSGSELRIDSETAEQGLKKAGIDPARRAETLDVAEFVRLSHFLGENRL